MFDGDPRSFLVKRILWFLCKIRKVYEMYERHQQELFVLDTRVIQSNLRNHSFLLAFCTEFERNAMP